MTDYLNTGSINTLAIDGYRQGVEITDIKHFDAGLYKIHAGEPGHIIRQSSFGMNDSFLTSSMYDDNIGNLIPRDFVLMNRNTIGQSYAITLPIVNLNETTRNYFLNDGVIDIFAVRDNNSLSLFNFKAPYTIQSIRGTYGNGNTDHRFATDQVVIIDERKTKVSYEFNDRIEMFASMSMLPSLSYTTSSVKPFNDSRLIHGITGSAYWTTDMITALSPLTGSTDTYISTKDISSTCGWTYDGQWPGTDSIAFGGMLY